MNGEQALPDESENRENNGSHKNFHQTMMTTLNRLKGLKAN